MGRKAVGNSLLKMRNAKHCAERSEKEERSASSTLVRIETRHDKETNA
jgi:hypothetical protein